MVGICVWIYEYCGCLGSHPEYKLVGICVWIYEYCGFLGSPRVPTRSNTTGPRAALPPGAARAPTRFINTGLGPPLRSSAPIGRPGRRQDLLIQGLARYAPRAPRAARAPKQFINTGLGPPFALGPLGRPGRRNNLLIQGLAPPLRSAPSGGPGAENIY